MIDFELPLEPKQVWLDARSEVFGQFFSRQGQPKASLYFQAIDLADAGRWDDAERYLHEALAADVVSGPILDREMNEDEVETRRVDLDAQIQRALVRVHLANGRLEAADQAKAAGKKLWLELERRAYPGRPIKPNSAVLLEARLALLKGRPRASLKILNQNKSRSREWYLAYALAACAVGRTAEFEEAVEEAEERGADVSLLDSCH